MLELAGQCWSVQDVGACGMMPELTGRYWSSQDDAWSSQGDAGVCRTVPGLAGRCRGGWGLQEGAEGMAGGLGCPCPAGCRRDRLEQGTPGQVRRGLSLAVRCGRCPPPRGIRRVPVTFLGEIGRGGPGCGTPCAGAWGWVPMAGWHAAGTDPVGSPGDSRWGAQGRDPPQTVVTLCPGSVPAQAQAPVFW